MTNPQDKGEPPLRGRVLRPRAASRYSGLAESTLAKRRLYGLPPRYVRLGGRAVGYLREDLDAWLESCRRHSTSDAPASAHDETSGMEA